MEAGGSRPNQGQMPEVVDETVAVTVDAFGTIVESFFNPSGAALRYVASLRTI
jgi:hypothetical protein